MLCFHDEVEGSWLVEGYCCWLLVELVGWLDGWLVGWLVGGCLGYEGGVVRASYREALASGGGDLKMS